MRLKEPGVVYGLFVLLVTPYSNASPCARVRRPRSELELRAFHHAM